MSSRMLEIGELVFKKYEIHNLIGEGAFGKVYRVRDIKLDRTAAMKIIDSEHSSMDRFINEIDGIKKLDHPNIVKLYDFDVLPDGSLCMMMEYVEGRELGDTLSSEGVFSIRRTVHISLQVLDALVETHEQGIIHCDLKPENILLTQKGARHDFVKLLDFGVATFLEPDKSASTKDRPLMGTPQYMAPEQIMREGLGPWTDIYALGLIMIELITGYFTVDGATPKEILQKQLHMPIHIPEALYRTDLGTILYKAVAKSPSERYQSAREMYDALDAAQKKNLGVPSWDCCGLSEIDAYNQYGTVNGLIYDNEGYDLFAMQSKCDDGSGDSLPLLAEAPGDVQDENKFELPVVGLGDDIVRPHKYVSPSGEATQQAILSPLTDSGTVPGRKSDTSLSAQQPAVNFFQLYRSQATRAQTPKKSRRKSILPIVIAVLIPIAIFLYFLPTIFKNADQTQADNSPGVPKNDIDKAKAETEEILIFNRITVTESMHTGACVAAVSGYALSLPNVRAYHYKIIASPMNSEIYINNVRLCSATPCRIDIFGDIGKIDAYAIFKEKKKRINLSSYAVGDTILLEIE